MDTPQSQGSVVERIGHRSAAVVERWMPSPFLFALILSYVVFAAGVLLGGESPFAMVGHWYDGFWAFLQFAMQMTLILMTGFVVAYHPSVNGLLRRLAAVPSNGRQAAVLVGVFAMAVAWIHWGLSLIVGAIFAREMGEIAHERGIDAHYPLLCLGGYMGLGLTWHWGLSGSAPLLLSTPNNDFIQAGVVDRVIPATETIFSGYALGLTASSIVFAAIVLYLLAPRGDRARGIEHYVSEERFGETAVADGGSDDGSDNRDAADADARNDVPAERIDNSPILGLGIALAGVLFVGYTLLSEGVGALGLNLVNFAFLFVGIALYRHPQRYRERFGEAAEAAAGIILLFPFFAGIQGMMNASGLSQRIAEGLFAVSTPETFPVVAWLAAAVVNLFVPSGGGEWIVLGPSVVGAANELGVPVGQATIAYAVGDAHTNLLNPFWALPLLAITRIKAREMFGYAVAMMLLLFPFLALALTFIPY